MAAVTVSLPGLLTASADGKQTVTVHGDTVRAVLDALVETYPALRIHLFDQRGDQREHVLMLYNGENLRWFDPATRETHDGDELSILQLVSGG